MKATCHFVTMATEDANKIFILLIKWRNIASFALGRKKYDVCGKCNSKHISPQPYDISNFSKILKKKATDLQENITT